MPEKLKQGWTRVAFGDVVRLCRERSAAPAEDGFDRYVGLEHLDPGDLKIRRWGNTAAGTTFTHVFRAGHVLFGKRRAYQKKVAVADFDGICSGDIYVLESADPKRLLPELLPFICQTDRFFEHAVGTSAGSLSPRTNWKSLSTFEFALPPLEEQRRIAEVLGSFESAIDCCVNCQLSVEAVLITAAADMLRMRGLCLAANKATDSLPTGWRWIEGCDVFTVMSGNGEPVADVDGDAMFLKVADFNRNDEELNITIAETRFMATKNPEVRLFAPGTVVFPKRGATIFLNKAGILTSSAALDPNLMGLVPNERAIHNEFLYWAIKSIGLWRLADTTSLPQLNHKHLNPLRIPLPPMNEQRRIVSRLAALRRASGGFSARCYSLRSMKANLIDDEFGTETP